MIIIKHRVNKINDLKNLDIKFGAEIDLRSQNKKIYLHHDPFKLGVDFSKWIQFFNHDFLILNVKEEGLEKKILNILRKKKIDNFFFHDQTFSTMLNSANSTNVSVRLSEFEEVKNFSKILKKIKWVWIDHFTKFILSNKNYKLIKKYKAKICLVSPELVNKNNYKKKIRILKKKLKKNKFVIDAVCTKYPNYWI